MKRLAWLVVLTLLAVPVLAQDGGGDTGDFFNLDSLGNFANVGRDFDPLVEVRKSLAGSKVTPMDKTQEKALKKLYEKEVKLVAGPYEKRFDISLKAAMGALQTPARGRRGSNVRRQESAQVSEARRLSELLVDKMIAGLRIDQQGELRRYQSEQGRLAKWNVLTNSLAKAGTPLTSDQATEAEAILARESRLRALLIIQAKGEPYKNQVFQLEAQTTQRLIALLDPSQRLTYAAATAAPITRPQRGRPPAPRGSN